MGVTLTTRQVGDVTVIDAAGRITLGDGANALGEGLSNVQGRKIVLNLKDVSYIDSSGVGELVYGFTTVKNRGGNLKLIGLPPRFKSLLQMTNLHTLFEVFEDEAAAVQSFG